MVLGAMVGATTLSAQGLPVPPVAEQVAAAVLPLPPEMRAGASVLGYATSGALVTLHKGTGSMVCLASAPQSPRYHVACYHESLEPFMARGRALRTQGTGVDQIDTLRFAEIARGDLAFPTGPAALFSITGERYDAETGSIVDGTRLFVVYIPHATQATTGLSATPKRGEPWIMFPGTPKAHIMFIPSMP